MFKGYLTYIAAAVGGIATGLHIAGILPADVYQSIMGFVGVGSVYGIRRALKNATDPVGKPE